jgi:hypothetical protein
LLKKLLSKPDKIKQIGIKKNNAIIAKPPP